MVPEFLLGSRQQKVPPEQAGSPFTQLNFVHPHHHLPRTLHPPYCAAKPSTIRCRFCAK
jgi:hypothetical protein